MIGVRAIKWVKGGHKGGQLAHQQEMKEGGGECLRTNYLDALRTEKDGLQQGDHLKANVLSLEVRGTRRSEMYPAQGFFIERTGGDGFRLKGLLNAAPCEREERKMQNGGGRGEGEGEGAGEGERGDRSLVRVMLSLTSLVWATICSNSSFKKARICSASVTI